MRCFSIAAEPARLRSSLNYSELGIESVYFAELTFRSLVIEWPTIVRSFRIAAASACTSSNGGACFMSDGRMPEKRVRKSVTRSLGRANLSSSTAP